MPRSLTIHIGTMKTGTSTLQYLLRHNRAALLERGLCYPAGAGGVHDHQMLAISFSSLPGLTQSYEDAMWGGRDPALVLAETREKFSHEVLNLPREINHVIISSERFSTWVREPADIAALHAFMAELFDDIRVLVYLRRQDAHYASNYSQTLRKGMVRKPAMKRWKGEGGTNYDYDKFLAPWADAFGEAAVKPRVFERDTNKSWDVVSDFTEATGCGKLAPPAEKEEVRNPSMNLSGQRILRDIGRELKESEDARGFARTAVWQRLTSVVTAALPGQGWRPTQTEARTFMQQFDAANERVRARWFPQRTRLFSDDFSHLPVKPVEQSRVLDNQATYTVLLHVLRQSVAREHEAAKRQAAARAPEDEGELSGKQKMRRRAALMRALRANKADVETRLELAGLQLEDGEVEAARHNITWVLRRAPEDARALELNGRLPAS